MSEGKQDTAAWHELLAAWFRAARVIALLALIAAMAVLVAWLLYDLAAGHYCREVITRGGHAVARRACRLW